MCGIIGCIDNNGKCLSLIKSGLTALEYRGYDSAGLTYFKDKIFTTIKSVGAPSELFKKVDLEDVANIGIAHTRWATHGKVCEINSHPHLSQSGKFSIVHNGIIENYVEIKQKFLKNYKFKSQTDSEIVADLLEYFYKGNVIDAIAILCSEQSDAIYYVKKDMSLLIGKSENTTYISSDITAFNLDAKKYAILPNLSFGQILNNKLKIYNFNGIEQQVEFLDIENSKEKGEVNDYCFFMEKEIYEIKRALINTLNSFKGKNSQLKKLDNKFLEDVEYIKIIGCGTSYHAGLIGQKLFEQNGIIANAELASEFIYSKKMLPKNTLAIFISQSGETADTLQAVKKVKSMGVKTLAITNVKNSALDKDCDKTLYLKAGEEKAVASTKAYNTQVLVFYIISQYLKNKNNILKFVNIVEREIQKLDIKTMHSQILPLAETLIKAKNIFVVGRDFDYVTSLEAGLKIKEITYKNCESFAAGELKHGTLALVDNKTIIIAYITEKELIDKTLNIVSQCKSRGAKIVIISQFNLDKLKKESNYFYNLPEFFENIMPLFSIIPVQLLSFETSKLLGHNPDKPRNLAKSVTVE